MAEYVDKKLKKFGIGISKPVLAIVCLISGLMVMLFPSLLVWIVGLFLVFEGALLLTDYFQQEMPATTTTTSRGIYCHNCGIRNTEEEVHCKRCGKELVQIGQIVIPQPQPQVATQ